MNENFNDLVSKGACCEEIVVAFADEFNEQNNAVLVYSEKEVCGPTAFELRNLALITGKLGKTAMGLVALKEKNNAQGLADMGIHPNYGIGGVASPDMNTNLLTGLENKMFKNLFVFGEDPIGCAKDKTQVAAWFANAGFVVVQDYFMTETTAAADLILPASLPFEIGGTFTNTQKFIQKFEAYSGGKNAPEKNSYEQLSGILGKLNVSVSSDPSEIMSAFIPELPKAGEVSYGFVSTQAVSTGKMFNFGCDNVTKRFVDVFSDKF
jgi:formate dehydrogenase major subunit